LADADPGSPSEWKEGGLVLAGIRDALRKPLRVELACIFSPDGGIMVNEQKGHQKVYSSRVFDPTELNFLVSSSV